MASGKKREREKRITPDTVQLCCDGEDFLLDYRQAPRRFQQLAMQWAYMARNRFRWKANHMAREDIERRAAEELQEFGLDAPVLVQMARAKLVEVCIPFTEEKKGWEARIFPWEYVLSAASRPFRSGRTHTILRHLRMPGSRPQRSDPKTALVVTSGPGELRDVYDFETERQLVESIFKPPMTCKILATPTLEALEDWIHKNSPDVVHFTGIDAHEGASLLGLESDVKRQDGFYLEGADGRAECVAAERLARAVNAGKQHKPRLVFWNTFNSAARLAALTVAEGASDAVGFQDEIDNVFAEAFLADFYSGYLGRQETNHYKAAVAFERAWVGSRERHRRSLRGSGIVLWSETSIGDGVQKPMLQPKGGRKSGYELPRSIFLLGKDGKSNGKTPAEALKVSIDLPGALNYSMLHNNDNLFRSFKLVRTISETVPGVEVSVEVQVGSDRFTYKKALEVTENPHPLEDALRVPLTWEYVSQLRESVRTTVLSEVRVQGHLIHRDTQSVSLQPVEEWADTERDQIWLPSFILPRDSEVERVVKRAERYLRVLADDPGTGFDGYQSLEIVTEDRHALDHDPALVVDLQVRAIWSTLVTDYDLGYINPPPSYSYGTQRLRTPTQVVQAGQGTCIDLALFFAACLEYVEIYPVIFLLKGHAFPAFWRSDHYYHQFQSMKHSGEDILSSEDEGELVERRPDSESRPKPWMVRGYESHTAILNSVRRGELVPLETVALTCRQGFLEAMEKGLENLEARGEFEFLVDVPLARLEHNVTPLPF